MAVRQEASTGQFVEDTSAAKGEPKTTVNILHVKVWSPFQVYFDGDAKSVSGVNGTGPFDILPQHRNFITLLDACNLVLQTQDGEVKIRISGGVMQVRKNVVTVFLEV
ncbi:MAG: FoF1 ATP synthase subunit delta/epsilon [Candidatus Micrarchaeaceae archaeon]